MSFTAFERRCDALLQYYGGHGLSPDFFPVSGLLVCSFTRPGGLERELVLWHCLFGLPASFFVVIETYWVLVTA